MTKLARDSSMRIACMEQLPFAIFQTGLLPSFSRSSSQGFPLPANSTPLFDLWIEAATGSHHSP